MIVEFGLPCFGRFQNNRPDSGLWQLSCQGPMKNLIFFGFVDITRFMRVIEGEESRSFIKMKRMMKRKYVS